MWRVYVRSGLVACVVAAVTSAVTTCATVRLALPGGTLAQTVTHDGEEWLAEGTETVVYYKTPFVSPPNLHITPGDPPGRCQFTDLTAESFKLRNLDDHPVTLKWKAEGRPAK